MAAREDVEGQIAIAPVVSMKEPVLLVSVEGVVGGVEIEDDGVGRLGVGL